MKNLMFFLNLWLKGKKKKDGQYIVKNDTDTSLRGGKGLIKKALEYFFCLRL